MTSTPDSRELGSLLEQKAREAGVAGAQFAVTTGDALVTAAYGTANPDTGLSMTTDTLVQIGSTTKVYTAALAMTLVDEGLVDLDRPVRTYLPGLRLGDRAAERSVTLRHLMSMSSGLDNGPYVDTGRGDDCVRRYVALLDGVRQHFPPGAGFGYSNASTAITGRVIEQVTGKSWDEALRERLLDPVGLRHSVSLAEELPYHQVAVGVGLDGDGRPDVRHTGWTFSWGMGPAGSTLATTGADLARFGRLFLRGGTSEDGTRLLSEDAVATMHHVEVDVPAKLFADRWCVGPYQRDWGGVTAYGHSGTTLCGSSLLLWIPDLDLALACLTNTADRGYLLAPSMVDAVLTRWFDVHRSPASLERVETGVDPRVYVGRYLADGLTYTVDLVDGELTITAVADESLADQPPEPVISGLIPLGDHRFWPEDPRLTSFHMWDIVFCPGPDGRIVRLLNGGFAASRAAVAMVTDGQSVRPVR